jgi:predicted nucleotidyltransferase
MLLKRYDDILSDIIIFGSAVKGKKIPNDIDLALILKEKNIDKIDKIKKDIDDAKVHIEVVTQESLLKTKISLNILLEGYSIEKKDFLRNLLDLKPVKLFLYNLKGFNRSKKSIFSMALTKNLKKMGGKRIAPGAVIISIDQSGYFNEFLEGWQIKYKTAEWTMF